MIVEALTSITRKLADFAQQQESSFEYHDIIIGRLGNLDHAGNLHDMSDKVICSIINTKSLPLKIDHLPVKNHLGLTLYNLEASVLFAFNFNQGTKDVLIMSRTLSFFLNEPIFTYYNTDFFDSSIKSIEVEPLNLTFDQQSQLWQMIGIPLLPHLYYKFTIRSIAEDFLSEEMSEVPFLQS